MEFVRLWGYPIAFALLYVWTSFFGVRSRFKGIKNPVGRYSLYLLIFGLLIFAAFLLPLFLQSLGSAYRPDIFVILNPIFLLLIPLLQIILILLGKAKSRGKKPVPVQWLLFTEEENKERGLGNVYSLHPKMVSAGLIGIGFGLVVFGTISFTLYPCGWGDVITGYSGCTREVSMHGRSIAVSPDGATVAVGGFEDNPLILLNADGSNKRELKGHTNFVNVVTFSPDSKMLVSGSSDNTFKVWRVSDGALLHSLNISSAGIVTMNAEFSPDGTLLATYTRGNKLQLWRVADWSELDEFPAGYQFAIGSASGAPIIHNKAEWLGIKGLANVPNGQAISSDGSLIATSKDWGKVVVTKLADKSVLYSLAVDGDLLAFSPDGKYLLTTASHANPYSEYNPIRALRLWSMEDGRLIKDFAPETHYIEAIAFSRDGKSIISTAFNHVSFWRI